MTLSYSAVDQEDLDGGNILYTKVYEITSRGSIILCELFSYINLPKMSNNQIVGTSRELILVAQKPFWANGVTASDLSGMSYTTLVSEDMGKGQERLTRGYTVATKGSIVLLMTKVVFKQDGKEKRAYTIIDAFWACGIQISGTDFVNIGAAVC